VLSHTSSALQLLKLPRRESAGLLLGWGYRRTGNLPLLAGASLLPSPGRIQKGNSRQCPTGPRADLPSAAGAGWCTGPWLWGVGEQGHGVPQRKETASHPRS